jgi:hypothetical protein
MDSHDRDQFKMRRRDETLARRLGEALDEMDARNASDCPDGEILAAYAEQGLGQAEAAKWESHFASCSRCRKILLVLAASADTPLAEKEVAHLGELVLGVRGAVEITGASAGRAPQKLWDWRTRWLAPALGAAAVLVVWFVMRPPWRSMDRGPSPTLVAQAPKQEAPPNAAPAELDQLSRVEPLRDQKALPAPPPDRPAKTPSLGGARGVPAEPRAESGNELKKVSPSGGLAGGALQREEKLGTSTEEVEVLPPNNPASPPPPQQAKAAAGASALAPSPQARAKADAAAPSATEVPQSTSQSVMVTEAAPQVETTNGNLSGTTPQQPSANLPLNGRPLATFGAARQVRGYSALLKSPSGSTFWRAGKGGLIERSVDAGKTWTPQISLSKEDWLAGAAVSDTVCWVAGRNGAIARTADGERWDRVAPPAQAAAAAGKLPDLTGVTAIDALNVIVTAGDGRRFATQDGGKTWQAQ